MKQDRVSQILRRIWFNSYLVEVSDRNLFRTNSAIRFRYNSKKVFNPSQSQYILSTSNFEFSSKSVHSTKFNPIPLFNPFQFATKFKWIHLKCGYELTLMLWRIENWKLSLEWFIDFGINSYLKFSPGKVSNEQDKDSRLTDKKVAQFNALFWFE